MIQINKPFDYPDYERITRADGVRHYIDPENGNYLTSVTTILSQTADHTELMEWRDFVGDKKADQIRDEACALGNLMHLHLENHVLGVPRPRGTNIIRKLAETMSDKIIAQGLNNIDQVWGTEVALHSRDFGFAGTTDLVATVNGVPTILDYKTTKKMKKQSSSVVQDYLMQLSAYILCHNELYGTNIAQGIVLMVSRTGEFEKFIISGSEIRKYENKFLERLESYVLSPVY